MKTSDTKSKETWFLMVKTDTKVMTKEYATLGELHEAIRSYGAAVVSYGYNS